MQENLKDVLIRETQLNALQDNMEKLKAESIQQNDKAQELVTLFHILAKNYESKEFEAECDRVSRRLDGHNVHRNSDTNC